MMTRREDGSSQSSSGSKSFSQGPRRWARALVLLGSIVFFYLGFLMYDVDVFKSIGLLVVFSLALVDVIVAAYLSLRAPREFRIDDSSVVAVWKGRVEKIAFDSLRMWRIPRLIFKGAVILRGEKRWFVVFEDMSGAREFLTAVQKKMVVYHPLK